MSSTQPTNSHPKPIGYHAGPLAWYRRLWLRRCLRATLLIATMIACVILAPWLANHVRFLYYQRQWMSNDPPPDLVAFAEPSDLVGRLEAGEPYSSIVRGATRHVPRSRTNWRDGVHQAFALSPPRVESAVLFMHRRTTPDGRDCVVLLEITDAYSGPFAANGATGRHIVFFYSVVRCGTLFRAPERMAREIWTLPEERRLQGPLRFFAGQPDATDGSRFSISYEHEGLPGIIDGNLQDNGYVRLVVRSGPARPSS